MVVMLAVGALKLTGIQLVHSTRTRYSRHGGGALGTQMNLFDRFARVVKVVHSKFFHQAFICYCFDCLYPTITDTGSMSLLCVITQSYANALISSFEDPEKILEQTVLEMNNDLIKMRQATAQVSSFAFPVCWSFSFGRKINSSSSLLICDEIKVL